MAQRTVALCDGKYIGIETIYTVVNGLQINIPEKLKDLRAKSQNNELFCPCGCGANLILVAGDKNLREQHFRIKDANFYTACHMVTEGRASVDSKIVLKCWLDENLHAEDLESRVPISALSNSTRKYEFSFVSQNRRLAINYCHDRANLSDEKLQILEDNSKGIHIIHVVDSMNGGNCGQYPEGLMKVQEKQGYCLLLSADDSDYNNADLKAVFYEQTALGKWKEICFAKGMLKEYKISSDGSISFKGIAISKLQDMAKQRLYEEAEKEKREREERDKRFKEYERQQQLEIKRQEEEQRKQIEEEEKRRKEEAEKQRLEEMLAEEEKRKREEEFFRNLEDDLNQQSVPVRDLYGIRWFRCEYCGKIADESEFSSYGGANHLNLGTCKYCSENNPAVELDYINKLQANKRKYDPMICPSCGKGLIERNGRNGRFIGCSGFPNCRFTRAIRRI